MASLRSAWVLVLTKRLLTISLVSAIALLQAQAATITTTTLGHNSTANYASAQNLPYADPTAPVGGTLSLDARGTFNAANKWMTTGVPMMGSDYLYDTLMTSSLDEAFTLYPQLATSATFDPDDTRWIIYHINPKARFWDGTPVTSSDVKATYEALLTKGPMFVRSYLGDIKSIETLDEHRVKFNFANSANKEILLTVGQFPIFAKSSIDKDFEKISLTPLMGSGAYQLGRVEAGRSVSYVRDPNYWGWQVMANRGRFNFNTIKYVYYQSDEIAFEGFKAGQYRFRPESKAANWATGYDFPAVKAGLIKKEAIPNANPVAMQAITMNQRRQIFKDIRVREALTLAFDFEWMNKTLFHHQYERLQSYFHGSELAAVGAPSTAELEVLTPLLDKLEPIQREGVLNPWQLPKSDSSGFNRENLLTARKLLLSAGFYYQDMKLFQPDGNRAAIEILMNDENLARVLLPYSRNLERLGFDVQLREVDNAQYYERMRRYDFDMTVEQFLQSLSPSSNVQAAYWGSASADEAGNNNTMGIKNPAIDSVIAKLGNAKNRDEIILYTKVLDRLLRAGHYLVPLYGKTTTTVAYWDEYRHVKNLPSNAIGIDYWWSDKPAAARVDEYLK